MNREWRDPSGRVWVILDVRRERNGVVEYLIISRDEITWRPRWSGNGTGFASRCMARAAMKHIKETGQVNCL